MKVTQKVKVKRYWGARENNYSDFYYAFMITFNDWRIGNNRFEEEYWNDIKVNDVFFIEQAVNSGLVLKITKNNTDFMDGIKNDYKDKKSSLQR